jgi:hypothetical protein
MLEKLPSWHNLAQSSCEDINLHITDDEDDAAPIKEAHGRKLVIALLPAFGSFNQNLAVSQLEGLGQHLCSELETFYRQYILILILNKHLTDSYGHTFMKIPALVRSRKSSMKRSSQYCGGRPRGNTGCCSFFPILKTGTSLKLFYIIFS